MTLFEVWWIVKRYRWLILGTCVLVGGLVAVHTLLRAPIYNVTVVMSPVKSGADSGLSARLGQLGSLIGMGGLGVDLGSGKNEVIAILKSRRLTEEFIQERKLLPVLFADRWDAQTQSWKVERPEEVPTIEDGYRVFDRNLRFVRDDPETGLVTLEIRWFDRNEAAAWANGLVAKLNADIRARAIHEAERNINYLNDQLEATTLVELRASISELIKDNISKIMMAKGREEFAFRVIDPAVPPDEDRYMEPYLLLRITIGLMVGFFLGLLIAFVHFFIRDAQVSAGGKLPEGRAGATVGAE